MSKLRTFGVATASVVVTLSLSLAGQAVGHGGHHAIGHGGKHGAVAAPPAVPTSDDQIQNVDQVKTAIKAYYGDTVTNQIDPVPDALDGGDISLHTYDPDGSYAHQMAGIVASAERFLKERSHSRAHRSLGETQARSEAGNAIVLDVDDTSLNTYNYEIYSNFVFNPTTNAAFVNASVFPPVPGMNDLANFAVAKGYTLFFLTGRPESQRVGTTANLDNAGFPAVPNNQLILKDNSAPWLSSCQPTCTTIQYKSLGRQHIESLGYDIVADFGDQFSDLTGGFTGRLFKIPNPMYFLP